MEKLNNTDSSFDYTLNVCRFKIVFVGDVNVGKSSIISRINDNPFKEEYEPSIGVDFFSKTLMFRDKSIKLQIWDSAGQEKYKALIPNYIRGSSIVFLLYDITKKETFDSLKEWIDFIYNHEKPNIIIVGNKCDLNQNRIIPTQKGKEFADENKLLFFETSAKTAEGLRKMLFTSVANLSYFNQFNESIQNIVQEIEKDSNAEIHTTRSSNFSILEMAKGNLNLRLNNSVVSENKNDKDEIIHDNSRKNKCKC